MGKITKWNSLSFGGQTSICIHETQQQQQQQLRSKLKTKSGQERNLIKMWRNEFEFGIGSGKWESELSAYKSRRETIYQDVRLKVQSDNECSTGNRWVCMLISPNNMCPRARGSERGIDWGSTRIAVITKRRGLYVQHTPASDASWARPLDGQQQKSLYSRV